MKKCKPCGGPKRKNDIVCQTCWRSLPPPLRTGYNTAPDIDAKRAAVRVILDHCDGTSSML